MISLILATALAATAADSLPPRPPPEPSPSDRNLAPTPEDPPAFATDVAVGYQLGRLGGPWMKAGYSGTLRGRYDAFARARSAPGARLGLSLWGATTVGPVQEGQDSGDSATSPADFRQAGVLGIIRQDPAAPVGLAAGLGVGRLDLDDYYGGPLALPTLTFEAGARFAATERAYADLLAQAHWATARSGAVPTALEEWWMVGLGVEVGTHLR